MKSKSLILLLKEMWQSGVTALRDLDSERRMANIAIQQLWTLDPLPMRINVLALCNIATLPAAKLDFGHRWLQAGLTQAGGDAVLLETRHVKAVLSAMTVKTDRKDAGGIAHLLLLRPAGAGPVSAGVILVLPHFRCTRRFKAPAPAGLEPGSPFGLNLRAFVLYLRFGQAIPFERLARLMRDLFGVEISEGALANLLDDSAPAFAAQTSRIKQHLLSGTVLACDGPSGNAEDTVLRVKGKTVGRQASGGRP